ncbi:MAG TPA: lamin tail domain-containing protein [Gemmatimonadaceae bacterium]|jgi:competence protein ComEC|nr:lamin tail domain-containing protein [Gemmatimonadaceae bacterium]
MRRAILPLLVIASANGCDRRLDVDAAGGTIDTTPRVLINEVMANPRTTADERGEWFEVANLESTSVDLRGWTIASENDAGTTIGQSVVVPAHGFAVLARDGNTSTNGGVAASFEYGASVALGNGADWLAIKTPDGRTADSVAWTSALAAASRIRTTTDVVVADIAGQGWATSTSRFGGGDLGTPNAANDAVVAASPVSQTPSDAVASSPARASEASASSPTDGRGDPRLGDPTRDSTLTVRVLNVGQGDAILVENGGSRVLIDGGPDVSRLGQLIEELGLEGTTIDAVILTHQHYDHYSGLRELFRTRRRIAVRYFFENRDPNANVSIRELRDSVGARARRGELEVRDTDDPCGTGASSCTITMRGGARLHVLRPDPRGDGPNNRSVAVKLLAPDSASFVMWLAGDAEHPAIRWFDREDYDQTPGMESRVLKADHHGSCDGISARYLDLVRPEIVMMSLASDNDYGYVHTQTLNLLAGRRIPWYRTDQNGTITITVPTRRSAMGGRAYSVSVERGGPGMRGPSDRRARDCGER